MNKTIVFGNLFSETVCGANYLRTLLLVFATVVLALMSLSSWAGSVVKHSFAFDVENGHIASPKRTVRVKEDDFVEISLESNRELELHLHGYDLLLHLKPGEPKKMSFHAHTAGRFPVSMHGAGAHGALIYIEIHPR